MRMMRARNLVNTHHAQAIVTQKWAQSWGAAKRCRGVHTNRRPARGRIAERQLEAVFPGARVRASIVHLLRYSLHFASWKERKPSAAALKPIYQADSPETAVERLDAFECSSLGRRYP